MPAKRKRKYDCCCSDGGVVYGAERHHDGSIRVKPGDHGFFKPDDWRGGWLTCHGCPLHGRRRG